MSVVSGSASNFADLQGVIEGECVQNGWALTDGILSKNGVYFALTSTTPALRLDGGTGQSGSSLTGQNTYGVKLFSHSAASITFPVNYDLYVFTNPDEVYCVINYNLAYYQALAFGKSDVPGIGGSGAWFTGSARHDVSETQSGAERAYIFISQNSFGAQPYRGLGLPFFSSATVAGTYHSSFVHCGLDGGGWREHGVNTAGSGISGVSYCAGVLSALPNLSNQATVLLPVKAVAYRNDNGRTIVANPGNVRYCRIDNIAPGDLVTFGSEQWKVYPMLRKDTEERNGLGWNTGATHSGTFGYAIRYPGA